MRRHVITTLTLLALTVTALYAVDPARRDGCQCQDCLCDTYPLTVTRVIDGDTIVADIDLGLGVTLTDEVIRANGYDAWETSLRSGVTHQEVAKGKEATEALKDLLQSGQVLLKSDGKRGKYGRRIGELIVKQRTGLVHVAKWAETEGHAKYD